MVIVVSGLWFARVVAAKDEFGWPAMVGGFEGSSSAFRGRDPVATGSDGTAFESADPAAASFVIRDGVGRDVV